MKERACNSMANILLEVCTIYTGGTKNSAVLYSGKGWRLGRAEQRRLELGKWWLIQLEPVECRCCGEVTGRSPVNI